MLDLPALIAGVLDTLMTSVLSGLGIPVVILAAHFLGKSRISNGIEAFDGTDRTPAISIVAHQPDALHVQLAVVDNGSGVKNKNSMFDPIVEARAGKLTANNNKTQGATFTVVLPRTPVSTPPELLEER